MDESTVLGWIHDSTLGALARDTSWLFLTAETAHFMGLSLLIGSLAVLDLRVLGFVRRVAVERLLGLIPVAIVGFGINLTSGIVMFAADPARYSANPWFRLKIALIAAAGLNALWYWLVEHRKLAALGPGQSAHASARVVAALSLALWLVVLTLGRFLPYVEEGV